MGFRGCRMAVARRSTAEVHFFGVVCPVGDARDDSCESSIIIDWATQFPIYQAQPTL